MRLTPHSIATSGRMNDTNHLGHLNHLNHLDSAEILVCCRPQLASNVLAVYGIFSVLQFELMNFVDFVVMEVNKQCFKQTFTVFPEPTPTFKYANPNPNVDASFLGPYTSERPMVDYALDVDIL